ncbi:MAG: glycosyltransferase family 9 protein, partial [Candidatus Glassbacteria bacterium]
MSSGSADGISPRSILLVMPMKGIGDFILSSPVVKNVRRQWPNASIEAVVRDKKSLGLSSRILPVDRYHPWSFDWLRDATRGFVLLGSFRRYGFDIVIDFMCDHSVSSALFSFLVGAPCTAGFSCSRRKLFFNHLVVPDWSANHITDDLHRLASSIGVQCIDRYPSIVINDDELNYARAFLEGRKVRAGMPLVSIHPGARDDLTKIDKRWHWMRFRALCRQLVEKACVQILVLGSHEEKQ